jgi:O-antigen/teichoic acid export membrane protein
LAQIFSWFVALSLIGSLCIGLFAKEALWLLTTPAYYSANRIVIILAPSLLLWNMYYFAPGIAIAKKTYFTFMINLGAFSVNFILNLLLIPIVGVLGAAMAMLISSFLFFIANIFVSQKLYYIPYKWMPIIKVALLACIIGISGSLIRSSFFIDIIIKIILLLLFLFFMLSSGLIRLNEIIRACLWTRNNYKSLLR